MACCDGEETVQLKHELILDCKTELEDYYADSVEEKAITTSFKCDLCASTFSAELSLKSHSRKCLAKRAITCTICNKNFSSNILLAVHVLTHKTDYRFKCKHCSKMFSALSEVENHVAETHRNKKKLIFECGTCNGRYKTEYMLRRHEFAKHGVLHRCLVCDEVFRAARLLQNHLRKEGH